MIATGTRIAVYEVASLIGQGGMGEVYSARDTRLNRNVALKVLPELFALDTERMARFEREAKLLASLNHPNIAAIYGLEESGSTRALVMELVEGPTLADRIRSGPIPVEEVLPIARQIAEALEYAHDHNVIHRDLKPANIKVTADGMVKVLDFGLAKAMSGDLHESDMSNSPTLSMAATRQGVILGTAAYMSPEQARGKTVDRRTDVWAFGVVLYEMLTGKQLFNGETVPETMASVMKEEPTLDRLPSSTPLAIRNLLRRCLEKNERRRLAHIAEARILLEDVLSGAAPSGPTSAVALAAPQPQLWRRAIPIIIAGCVTGLLAVSGTWLLTRPAPQPITRTVVDLPAGDRLGNMSSPVLALSRDGTQLAYVAVRSGVQQIYLRALNSLEARPLAGTTNAEGPFFSPDGQWIGFFAEGRLKKISVSGGPAVTLCAAPGTPRGASWGQSGKITFGEAVTQNLFVVADAGGSREVLTKLAPGETGHRWPEYLPGNGGVLFSALNGGASTVSVQSPAGSVSRNLVPGGTAPHYAASGHLIYLQGGSLMATPFDRARAVTTGPAAPVVEGIVQSSGGAGQFSVSENGTLAYVPGGIEQNQRRLVWVSRTGIEQTLPAPPRTYEIPRISPDGRRVAVGSVDDGEIMVYDLQRGTLTRFTFEGGHAPAWTPDGKRIAFASRKTGVTNSFWQLADGSGGLEQLTSSQSTSNTVHSFTPDGKIMAFRDVNPTTGGDIWTLRLDEPSSSSPARSGQGRQTRKAEPFLRSPFNEGSPRFSPDGHWLAYVSDESGRYEVYVQPYPGPGGKYQISTEGGMEPVWNPKGRELFYRSNNNKMMAVEVSTQPNFAVGTPKPLFDGEYVYSPASWSNYDVSPDGQRFLMIKPTDAVQAPTQIVVVQNWFEELKRRVPTGTK